MILPASLKLRRKAKRNRYIAFICSTHYKLYDDYLSQGDKGDGGDEDGTKEHEDSSDDDSDLKGGGGGFGGIVGMQSVQEIIAKARVSEEILQLSTAGLTDDLSDLVNLVEEEDGNKSSNEEERSE